MMLKDSNKDRRGARIVFVMARWLHDVSLHRILDSQVLVRVETIAVDVQ